MRGEHRLDADLLQQLEHIGETQSARLEGVQRGFDTTRLRPLAGFEEIAAAAADTMYLLGQVDRAKPHREGAREITGHLRSAAAQLYRQFGRGLLVAGS